MLFITFIGIVLFVVTTAIHTGGMLWTLRRLKLLLTGRGHRSHYRRLYLVAMVVNSMFLVSILEVSAWALVYVVTGAVEGVEKALYFSAVTFTTLGYGDIVLAEKWRLLAGFEAANGIIMFGWTTAIVINVVQALYAGGRGEG